MTKRMLVLLLMAPLALSGCAMFRAGPRAHNTTSSSLVGFLYPNGNEWPQRDTIPELRLPLRVGLAFLPSQGAPVEGLEAARREELLERIRAHFADRRFVSRIDIVPDYYLTGASGYTRPASVSGFGVPAGVSGLVALTGGSGFAGLAAVQRLYNVDVMALVSYDQVTYRDENNWSLGYLTIVGAYVLKGNRHDVTTLVDLAVVDPVSRSIVLRAGGTDTRHGTTTYIKASAEAREAHAEGFSAATDQLIGNFDTALTRFESDVRAGKANVRVTSKSGRPLSGGGGGGGGALDWATLLGLGAIVAMVLKRARDRRTADPGREECDQLPLPQSLFNRLVFLVSKGRHSPQPAVLDTGS